MSHPADPMAIPSIFPESDGPAPTPAIEKQKSKIENPQKPIPWVSAWILLLSLSALVSSLLVMLVHGRHGFFVPAFVTMLCILAALFDGLSTRIPNPLTYTAILVGLLVNAAATLIPSQQVALWLAAPGLPQACFALAVCLPLALLGLFFRVGGGDLKLLLALGAILGLYELGSVLIIALTIALFYGLVNLALSGRLNTFIRVASLQLLEILFLRRFPADLAEMHKTSSVPMAVPLALGLLIAQVINLRAWIGGAP